MSLKTPGNLLYLVGTTRNELAGSYYAELMGDIPDGTKLPHVTIEHAYATMKALGEAIRRGMVRACHDLSEGGLAVAVAEMAIAGQLGVSLDLSYISIVDMPDGRDSGTKNSVRSSASRLHASLSKSRRSSGERLKSTCALAA